MNSKTLPKPGGNNERFATLQEARAAIIALQEADYAKLMLIATGFTRGRLRGTVVEPEDLLHAAIAKTLDGHRKWNRNVSIIKHLDRVMESDAGHEAKRRVSRDLRPLSKGDLVEPAAQLPLPGARLTALDELEGLLALFADDQTALALLHLKGDGFSASEIQRELGIGKTQYDTVKKRIRRRLAKHLAEGDK